MELLIALLLIASAAWFWLDSLRAREAANAACRSACEQRGLQFLDDTVALRRLGIGRDALGHARLKRQYQFEFTADGRTRYRGRIVLLGARVLELHLPPADLSGLPTSPA
jgi:hypothetical protein